MCIFVVNYRCQEERFHRIHPHPTGTPDFPPPTEGGGDEHPPVYLGSYWSLRKTEKMFEGSSKNDYETISVNFWLRSKLWPPGPKHDEIFEFFAIVEHRFGKPPLSLELL